MVCGMKLEVKNKMKSMLELLIAFIIIYGCSFMVFSEIQEITRTDFPDIKLDCSVKNEKDTICTDRVIIEIDGKVILCEENLTLTLYPQESESVSCTSSQLSSFTRGIHNVDVSYCGTHYSYTIGRLKAKILSPSDGEIFQLGETILFNSIADEGIYKGTYNYLWKSNKDGILGRKRFISLKNLSLGIHNIVLKVSRDSKEATDSISIRIIPKPLQVKIKSPLAETTYKENQPINFSAQVTGGIEPYTYEWLSDNIIIGNEKIFSARLPLGLHKITLIVKDRNNNMKKHSVYIFIEHSKEPPLSVSIASPRSDELYTEGDSINLIASLSGGREPYNYQWTLDGKKIEKIESISPGKHEIALEVIDANRVMERASIEIFVREICNKDGICDPRENYENCPEDCPSGSGDGYCDGLQDLVCDPDCSRSEDVDCFCNRDGTCEVKMENYLNCPQDCPSGSLDNYCDGLKDDICDPDCKEGEDPDCGIRYPDYMLLLIMLIIIVIVYLRFIRR